MWVIQLLKDRCKWRHFVSTVMRFRFTEREANLLI
jgi:hypothetical protein